MYIMLDDMYVTISVHSALVYVIQVCRQLSSRTRGPARKLSTNLVLLESCLQTWSCSKAVYKPVWHTPVPSVQWINSWWWTEELPETWRISCRSKFGKLVHLVVFIIMKTLLHVSVLIAPSSGRTYRMLKTMITLFDYRS